MIPVVREVGWICVAVLRAICFVADETTARASIGSEEIAWAQPELPHYSVRFLPKLPTPQRQNTNRKTHTAVSEWPQPCSAAHCSPRSSPAAPGRPGLPPGSVSGDVGPRLLRARCLPTPPNPSPPPPLPPAATAPRRSRLSCRSSRSSR